MKREDLRIQKTKQAIRSSLLSLLREKDFESITVKDIIQRAVIGKGTFYYHYRDKYDLVEQLVREDITDWVDYMWGHYLRRGEDVSEADPELLQNLYRFRDIRSRELSLDRLIRENLREVITAHLAGLQGFDEAELTAQLFSAMVYELFFETRQAGEELQVFDKAVAGIHKLTGIILRATGE